MVNGNTTQRNLQIEHDPYQHIHDIFHRTRTNNTKMYIETLKTQNCQSNTMGKNKAGAITLPDIRQYCKVTVITTVCAKTDTEINEQKTESTEINPQTQSQLILDKGGKNMQSEKDSLFSKWCWDSWTAACKSVKLEHTLTQK